jgi:hypothetical protein
MELTTLPWVDYEPEWLGGTGYMDGANPDNAPVSGKFIDESQRIGLIIHATDETGQWHTLVYHRRYPPKIDNGSFVSGSHYGCLSTALSKNTHALILKLQEKGHAEVVDGSGGRHTLTLQHRVPNDKSDVVEGKWKAHFREVVD